MSCSIEPRRLLAAVTSLGILLSPVLTLADESTSAGRRARAAREQDRPHMMAEVGAAILTLPAAELCISDNIAQCEQGEESAGFSIQNIYRYRAFAFGAGIRWAAAFDTPDPEGPEDLGREHSRRYFFVDGQFRYYAIRKSSWEWWVGGTIGGVVVNDSWSVKEDRDPYADTAFVGPRAVTIRTEGFETGLGLGTEWSFADNWLLGAQLRYSIWILPFEREESPTGDRASLQGRVSMIDFNIVIAYQLAM